MQAVPFHKQKASGTARWLLHGAIVGSFVPLLLQLSGSARLPSAELIPSLQHGLQRTGAPAESFEWLSSRNPGLVPSPRYTSSPLPAPFARSFDSSLGGPLVAQVARRKESSDISAPTGPVTQATMLPTASWVQTHREASLFSGPEENAQRFTVLPQWSYLKVLDSVPGWLLVGYEGDRTRQAGQAWVSAGAVGPIDTPRWLSNPRETPLYAGPEANAPFYTRLPAWSVLEEGGQEQGERVLVRYAGDGDTRQAGLAWARRADFGIARAPAGSRLPWGEAPGSPDDRVHLAVPYRTQLDGSPASGTNCGPASVGMALEAFGLLVSTPELRQVANRLQGTWDPDEGVKLEVLHALVQSYDLRALDLERPAGGLRRWTLEDARRHLRAGHPVIPQLRYRLLPGHERAPAYDHYVVLTGFSGDTFFYNDPTPYGGQGQEMAITATALLQAWERSDFPLAAFAITR